MIDEPSRHGHHSAGHATGSPPSGILPVLVHRTVTRALG